MIFLIFPFIVPRDGLTVDLESDNLNETIVINGNKISLYLIIYKIRQNCQSFLFRQGY
jgi:hypothetical protein